jgi:GNAT superfamily N-acetyltransferase
MLNEKLKYLFEENNYSFYSLEETGFSSGSIALEHELYEDFGPDFVSRYYEIFNGDEHTEDYISQVWIYHDKKPIGLGMVIHEDDPYYIKDNHLASFCLGHIQLYILEEHRGQGLAKKLIPLLEEMVFTEDTYFPPSVVMQDNAYYFKKYLQKTIAIPYPKDSDEKDENKNFLFNAFKNIGKEHYIFRNYPNMMSNILEHKVEDSFLSSHLCEKLKKLTGR